MRVKLRISEAAFHDIAERIRAAGQPERFWPEGGIDMQEIVVVPDLPSRRRAIDNLPERMPNQ